MMKTDFYAEAGTVMIASRLRRLADQLMQHGSLVYLDEDLAFEPAWFPVFYYLYRHGPHGMTEIAGALHVSHPHVNQIGKQLIAADLVMAYRDRNDKRRRVLALTSTGRT